MHCYAFLNDESLFMLLNCDVIGSLTYRHLVLDSEQSTCLNYLRTQHYSETTHYNDMKGSSKNLAGMDDFLTG